jgi:hypothetical protein
MGLAQIHVDAVAGAASLSDQGRPATGSDGDANAGGVSDAPAGLLLSTDRALGLSNAADGDGLALPAVKAKDAVRFRDDLPAFEVCHLPAALLALADIGPIEGGARAASCSGEKPDGWAGWTCGADADSWVGAGGTTARSAVRISSRADVGLWMGRGAPGRLKVLAPLEEGAATVMAMGSDGVRRREERNGIRKKGPRQQHQNPM